MNESDYSSRYGYIDRTGKLVVPCIYDYVSEFSEGLGRVKDLKTELYGCVDGHGKLVIRCKFESLGDFSDGLASFEMDKGRVKGFIRTNGEEAFRHPYDAYDDFHDGVAIVGKGSYMSMSQMYGLIDKNGKLIVPIEYTSTRPFSEGIGLFQTNWETAHFFDNKGHELFAGRTFIAASGFVNGLAAVCEVIEGRKVYGFIDREGKMVQEVQVDGLTSLNPPSEGLACFAIGKWPEQKWGLVDLQGKVVIEPQFHLLRDFHNGVAVVCRDFGSWGFIDTQGRTVFRHPTLSSYSDEEFCDGLMRAENAQGNAGFVDTKGEWVIAPRFYSVEPFAHGLAEVLGDTSGYIDRAGRWVWIREH